MTRRDDGAGRGEPTTRGRRAKAPSPIPSLGDDRQRVPDAHPLAKMESVTKLHPCARTTLHIRRMIQESELSDRKLAAVYNTTAKTINKWRNRDWIIDQPMGPKAPNSCLGRADQSFVKHYRLFTGFGVDECLLRLREIFPKLTRTSLYRCFARHGVGRIRRGKTATIKQETAKFPAGHFFFTVHRTLDVSALFAAVEEGSGRVFTRRLEYSVEGAISFLKQLIEHLPEGVKQIATPHDEKVFHLSLAELLGLAKARYYLVSGIHVKQYRDEFAYKHPFAAFCRRLSLPHLPHFLENADCVSLADDDEETKLWNLSSGRL